MDPEQTTTPQPAETIEKSPLQQHAEALAAGDPDLALVFDDPGEVDSQPVAAPESPEPAGEVAEPVPEPAAQEEAVTEPEQPDPAFEERFAALAKREREVRELVEETKQRQRDLELAKERPMEFLAKFGWDYDALTTHYINGQQAVPEGPAKHQTEQQLAQLHEKFEQLEAARAQEKFDSAKAQYMEQIRAALAQDPEKFGLTAAFADDPAALVFDTVSRTYNSEQRILSPAEAAQLVEDDIRRRLMRAKEAAWVKQQFLPQPTATPANPATPKASKTLTNDLSAEKQPAIDTDDLLDDDSALMELARKQLFSR